MARRYCVFDQCYKALSLSLVRKPEQPIAEMCQWDKSGRPETVDDHEMGGSPPGDNDIRERGTLPINATAAQIM